LPILQNMNCHYFDRKEGGGWGREKSKGERKTEYVRKETGNASQTVQILMKSDVLTQLCLVTMFERAQFCFCMEPKDVSGSQ